MALDFPTLVSEVQVMPTVQAGLITVLTRVRNAIELAVQTDKPDVEYLRWLCGQLDSNSALLSDAVITDTPCQELHEERAARIQRQAD